MATRHDSRIPHVPNWKQLYIAYRRHYLAVDDTYACRVHAERKGTKPGASEASGIISASDWQLCIRFTVHHPIRMDEDGPKLRG